MKERQQKYINDEMSQSIIDTVEKLASEQGAESVTVRMVMRELNITNRVFYNRFRNIDEVLEIIYENTVLKIRESIISEFDPEKDFFTQVINIVANTLVMSYENKMNLNHYIFENDSTSEENYNWWKSKIEELIEFGKQKGFIGNIDSKKMSYSIWCFIRGYNADALGRGLKKEEALENFKYSFGILLDGMAHPTK
ncbi:MAG: TetR/AcrR family transcriptional regulator [Ruminococcaceae bacterium]|nr:TetR/AcrR family transcriptional regulator [Oscillospiraceae bacterium]MBE6965057.1 TetR/AcrR family transcriptional regulator [Oscillospiraceae bacterium]